MSPEVDTVLAETILAKIVIVSVIVLLSFWSLNPGFFETVRAFNGIPSYNVGNEELNEQTLAVNVFNMYGKVSEFNAELEQAAQTLSTVRRKTDHKIKSVLLCFIEDFERFFRLSFFQTTAHLRDFGQRWYKSEGAGLLHSSVRFNHV